MKLVIAFVVAALFLNSSAVLAVRVAEELPAPEVLTTQISKVTKIITMDEKACDDTLAQLNKELATHQATIKKLDAEVKTATEQVELSKQQLTSEIQTIQNVRELIVSAMQTNATTSSSSKTTTTTTISQSSQQITDANNKIAMLEKQNSNVAGVLRDIVASMTSDTPAEFQEVLTLLDNLIANLQSGLNASAYETIQKTYSEKVQVTNGLVATIQEKIANVTAECQRRRSEFTEILAVLKLIEAKYENITIPDCQPALDVKNKEHQQCLSDKTSVDQALADANKQLEECRKINPLKDQCDSDLVKCNKDKTVLSEQVQNLQKFESEVNTVRKEIQTCQTDRTKCVSEKTTIEAKLTETRDELTKTIEKAKCAAENTRITQLETQIRELSIKVDLGEKCAANYKALTIEKSELIKQLEKLSIIHKQLETCQFNAAKSAKECSEAAIESSQSHAKAIEKLTIQIKELNTEISRLQEQSKCVNEKTVIEKYEKELITIKTETKTVVTQVETEAKGLRAELDAANAHIIADTQKINTYFTKITTLEQQLKIIKADHENCVTTHTKSLKECKGIAADLEKCQSDLKVQMESYDAAHKLQITLEADKQSLQSEVKKLDIEETALKVEVTKLTTTIRTEEDKIIDLQQKLKSTETKEQELSVTRTHLVKTIKESEIKIETLTKTTEKIEIQLKGADSGNAELKTELQRVHKEREDLLNAKIALEAKLKKIDADFTQLTDFKSAAITHLKEAKEIIDSNDKKIDDLTAKIATVTNNRLTLVHRLDSCNANLKTAEATIKKLHQELSSCQKQNGDLQVKLVTANDAAKCVSHKATISELKKHSVSLRAEIKSLNAVRTQLSGRVASLEAKLSSWQQLNHKLQADLKECTEGHVGCRSSVRALKQQLLSHLRKLKEHVTSIGQLEEKVATLQMELAHTRKQWQSDKAAYKAFKDNLLEQMAKLIALAKDAKKKFDIARAAAKNELKVQDAQWGVCRKEVLNYERMLGSGVVKAEKEKAKTFSATKKYMEVKKAAVQAANNAKGASSKDLKTMSAQNKVKSQFQAMSSSSAKSGSASTVVNKSAVVVDNKKDAATTTTTVKKSSSVVDDKKDAVKKAAAAVKAEAKKAAATVKTQAKKAADAASSSSTTTVSQQVIVSGKTESSSSSSSSTTSSTKTSTKTYKVPQDEN